MMIVAVVIAMGIMLVFSTPIAKFVNVNPTIKMLALVFLIAIGVLLIVESLDVHVNKAYVYVAMAFSLVVELLNLQMRRNIRVNKEKTRLLRQQQRTPA
jgi:predicted tellurium resistance membrane protein TerC